MISNSDQITIDQRAGILENIPYHLNNQLGHSCTIGCRGIGFRLSFYATV